MKTLRRPQDSFMLILYYSTMWGRTLRVPESGLAGVEFTTDRRRYASAHAVIFHIPQLNYGRWLFLPAKLPGQLWVAWSEESEENHPLVRHPRFVNRFDLTMTYRRTADIPVFYLPNDKNLVHGLRQAIPPKISEPLVAAFVSSSFNRSRRKEYIQELTRYLPIASYGSFLRNRTLADDQGPASKLETIARYKFTLAFENSCCEDYVTEKFYEPLLAGSVPIYLGAPNVEQFAPGEHCFIDTANFRDPRHLAEYLRALDGDDAAYQAYFAWKERPYRAEFQNLLAFTNVTTAERLCERIRAKLKGG